MYVHILPIGKEGILRVQKMLLTMQVCIHRELFSFRFLLVHKENIVDNEEKLKS